MNLLEAIDDPKLFAPWFKTPETWAAWRAFLKALFALPMTDAELAIYRDATGRTAAPDAPSHEAWLVVGRRGGKSFTAALVAVYLACFCDYRRHLQPGERATVMLIAADKKQARVLFRYIKALIEGVPMIASMIARHSDDTIELTNRVSIEIMAAGFRGVRGYTLCAAILDEAAYWRNEDSTNPDHEIVAALRPAMATIPGAMLLGISSPYRRAGVLYDMHRRHHGVEGSPVLAWQAASRVMNPALPERVVTEALERDPAAASAEFLAQFRDDITGFLAVGLVERAMRDGGELAPREGVTYRAFCDPSGGGADAFTLAIAHREGARRIVDLVRGRRGDLRATVAEFAALLHAYGISTVTGDRYAGDWPSNEFSQHAITFRHSEKSRSEIYLEALPLFTAGDVELPADRRLEGEFKALERRTARSGRDSVDHPPRGHDDYANAAAGALWLCGERSSEPNIRFFNDVPVSQSWRPPSWATPWP